MNLADRLLPCVRVSTLIVCSWVLPPAHGVAQEEPLPEQPSSQGIEHEYPSEAEDASAESESTGASAQSPRTREGSDSDSSRGSDATDPNLPPAGATIHAGVSAEPSSTYRLVIPPLLIEKSRAASTTAVFPFYYSRDSRLERDRQLLIGPYYQRRGTRLNVDVAFPLFWSFRYTRASTWVVPPFYFRDARQGFDVGVAPLFFHGHRTHSSHTIIPPLLTAAWADKDDAATFVGPFWRIRDKQDVNWGVFPVLWVKSHTASSFALAPPLLFHFADGYDQSATTVVPPFYHYTDPRSAAWGLFPLLLHEHDRRSTSWTVPPLLFHYSRGPSRFRLITPLFASLQDGAASTLITPLYQRHRGVTELDAVAPFFFHFRDPREHTSSFLIPPLVWHRDAPGQTATVVFPFFGYWHAAGDYTTWITPLMANSRSHARKTSMTWVIPTFQLSSSPTSSTFNIHPLLYATRARKHRHLVFAPLYWDFEDYEDRDRTTILFPFLWRFREASSVAQVAVNTYYRAGRTRGVPYWEFHFFPLFAFGKPNPTDHFWTVLYGLAGYRRQGRYARANVLWIPFKVDGPSTP